MGVSIGRIKANAQDLLKKNHWFCVGVTILVSVICNAKEFFSSSKISFPDARTLLTDLPSTISDAFSFFWNLYKSVFFTLSFSKTFSSLLGLAFTFFVAYQVKVGLCRLFLKYRKDQPVSIAEIFESYKDKTFINVAKVTFMKDLFTFLWSLLLVIPGIIKKYEYAAVNYILSVNPTMDYKTALDLSKRIMDGRKFQLFLLELSFIGWHILSVFTFGILEIIYVRPYLEVSKAEFFAAAREAAIKEHSISYYDVPDYEKYNPNYNYNNNFNYTGHYANYQAPVYYNQQNVATQPEIYNPANDTYANNSLSQQPTPVPQNNVVTPQPTVEKEQQTQIDETT